jgi:hypothetical protein
MAMAAAAIATVAKKIVIRHLLASMLGCAQLNAIRESADRESSP